jgi:hypothetical protein
MAPDADARPAHDEEAVNEMEKCETCGGTGRWMSSTEESPNVLVDLGPCTHCCEFCESTEGVEGGLCEICFRDMPMDVWVSSKCWI